MVTKKAVLPGILWAGQSRIKTNLIHFEHYTHREAGDGGMTRGDASDERS